MIAEFFQALSGWFMPTVPMLQPVGIYMTIKEGEESPSENVVTVQVKDTGRVDVTTVPAPEDEDPTPKEPVDLFDERDDLAEDSAEVTGIRNLNIARMGTNKAAESLNEVINRFRKKSGQLQQVKLPDGSKDEK